MTYVESQITGPDGRSIEVATVGDPAGLTVFFHHGTPGAASLVKVFAHEAEQTGLFFVTMSRAGYGLSARDEGRRVSSVVSDARAVLDGLGREDYVAVGWSGGGPHALACAALDAPRCRGAWSLAGVVPIDVDFDWTEGMGPENLEEFALAKAGGREYEGHVAAEAERFTHADAENIIELFGGLLCDEDKAALGEVEARTILADACRHAFDSGYGGFYDDDRAFFTPWGFDPASIEVPVNVWYGDQDLMVPPSHGAWLAKTIPHVKVTHKPHEGHLSLITEHLDELVSSLAKAFRP